MSGSDGLSYVYAIARPPGAVARGEVARAGGVDGATVHLVAEAGLVAVVSAVAADAFGEAALRERLEDMTELEELARAHHEVVDLMAAYGTVLPLRLATVYHGDDRVADMLARGRTRFANALDRLADRVEWGVKVYTESDSPATPEDSGPRVRDGGPHMGRDYLRRRKEKQRAAEESLRQAAGFADRVDDELSRLAADVRRYRPQNPRLSRASGDNVLNVAYLVAADRAAAFATAARDLDGAVPGTRVELTGPWAPYSFTLPDPERTVVDGDHAE